MAKLFNRVGVATATTGTGTVTLGTEISDAYCTFAEAGVSNSDVVNYVIDDGLNFELGYGTYSTTGPTLTRDRVLLSQVGGTAGTSKLNLSGSATVRCVMLAQDIVLPQNYLTGVTLSNNTSDATNDIDIAAGIAADGTNLDWMVLGSTLTKRLDAAWAVGSGNGGLDTGSIANTTYHIWLIKRLDTGVVDALFSTSASSPTMPTNYTLKRRIGSIIRASNAIRLFWQTDDTFLWRTNAIDRNSTSALSYQLITITVPTGIRVQPMMMAVMTINSAGSKECYVSDGRDTGNTAGVTVLRGTLASDNSHGVLPGGIFTNTSAQVHCEVIISSGTLTSLLLQTFGYIDKRGRDG